MASPPRGIEVTMNYKKAASFAEASGSSGFTKLPYYSEGFRSGNNVTEDPEIGGTRYNLGDPLQGIKTRPSPTGALDVAADLNHLGIYLQLMMGDPVTEDADDPVFEHEFESGKDSIGLGHFEFGFGTNLYKIADAFTVSQLTMDLADNDGYRRIQAQLAGRSVRFPVPALAVTPADMPPRAKLLATVGKLQIGPNFGALVDLGNVLGGQLTLANGAYTENYLDDTPWAGAVLPGAWTGQLTPELRFTRDQLSLLSSFDGETPFVGRLIMQKSADLRVQWDFGNIVANSVEPVVGGTGTMSVQPTFMLSQSATAPMCKVTLRNAVEAY